MGPGPVLSLAGQGWEGVILNSDQGLGLMLGGGGVANYEQVHRQGSQWWTDITENITFLKSSDAGAQNYRMCESS